MSFSITAAEELELPIVLFFPAAACGFKRFKHYQAFPAKGFTTLKGGGEVQENEELISVSDFLFFNLTILTVFNAADESYMSNGYLDTVID